MPYRRISLLPHNQAPYTLDSFLSFSKSLFLFILLYQLFILTFFFFCSFLLLKRLPLRFFVIISLERFRFLLVPKVIYVFVEIRFDPSHLVVCLKQAFKSDSRLLLMGTIQFTGVLRYMLIHIVRSTVTHSLYNRSQLHLVFTLHERIIKVTLQI